MGNMNNMTNEIWKDIPGYEGLYQASNYGHIRSVREYVFGSKEPRLLKNPMDRYGYLKAVLYKDNKPKHTTVHQLVAMAFLGHTPCGCKLVIDHINYVRNDNRLENLRVVTTRENSSRNRNGKSKYTGVDKTKYGFRASIVVNGKTVNLGGFKDELEASQYYQNALIAIENGTEIIAKPRKGTSRYRYVHFSKTLNKWVSKRTVNHKYKLIGQFDTELEAHNAVLSFCEVNNLKYA